MTDRYVDPKTEQLIDAVVRTYQNDSGTNFIDVVNLPVREKVLHILEMLFELLFPGYGGSRNITRENVRFVVGDLLCHIRADLTEQVALALRHQCRIKNCSTCDCDCLAKEVTDKLLARLPEIRDLLKGDVQAAYDGDPAAKSFEEIVIAYPCIQAIGTHRIAHELYRADVPLIPRIMSESAHSKTGIDIHPGARIGRNFFIDHGTGVVIGETAVIGCGVKIYQGVTLGAMSFPRDERGRIIKGGKRHPTIEDNVTIYAEATILGDIVIGAGSIVSGNAWVTKPVPPGSVIAPSTPRSKHREPGQE
ncbi:MAG: serine acetyltransferase [Phycisphaerae bacterium]|nr:serine acetyltransferase [Phycisphaerae bacterium]